MMLGGRAVDGMVDDDDCVPSMVEVPKHELSASMIKASLMGEVKKPVAWSSIEIKDRDQS